MGVRAFAALVGLAAVVGGLMLGLATHDVSAGLFGTVDCGSAFKPASDPRCLGVTPSAAWAWTLIVAGCLVLVGAGTLGYEQAKRP